MIAGVGIDLVLIPRIEEALARWGDRFKNRVFTPSEIAYSENHQKSAQHFAANFAVKEAFFKALGKGNIRMLDIEVQRDINGKPYVTLYGEAKRLAEQMGINSIHTSISHDGEYSVAVVIIEK